jgi:hypothetical protein
MTRIARFFALSGADRMLLVEALVALVLARAGLRFVPIQRLRAWAQCMKPGTRPIERIAWAADAVFRVFPGTTCLARALALQRLLSTEGHPSELHIGVARRQEAFAAHAWLACQGRILVGEDEQEEYTRLVAWRAGDNRSA